MAAPSPQRSGSIRAQLERIAASSVFAHAGRMSRLLAYLVEAELAGDGARLNQSRIAIDVFGRNGTFDPSVDSIVRVEIGRLRNKLREYYATDGRDDAIVFELPKGRYSPSIRLGEAALARPQPSDALGAEPAEPRDQSRGRRVRYLAVAVALSVVALIGVAVFDARSGVTDDAATVSPRQPSGSERWSTESPPTTSPKAYALYLQAWDGLPNDPHSLLDEALALDPTFVLAHAAKALFHSQSLTGTVFGPTADPSDFARVQALVREHAGRALSLDPATAHAHIAVGNLNMYTWHWTEARRAFELAATTAPDEVALLQYAYLDSYSGRVEDAIARLEHLVEANKPSPLAEGMLGLHQAYAKDYDAAAASLRAALSGVPQLTSSNLIARGWLVAVEIARGNPQAAVQELELMEQLAGTSSEMLPSMAHAYARAGRAADARRLFDRFEHAAVGAEVGAAWVEAYLAIGEDEKALEWLRFAAQKAARHEPDANFYPLMHLRMNVLADPVLDRPEFVAVLDRIRGD
jgi:tetratricopeptide (TPR) repeat protein